MPSKKKTSTKSTKTKISDSSASGSEESSQHDEKQDGAASSSNLSPIAIQRYLKGVGYPANKQTIIARAEENGAEAKVLEFLQELPSQEYDSPIDIQRHFGKGSKRAS